MKEETLIKDTAVVFDETNEALVVVKASFPYKRTITKHPHLSKSHLIPLLSKSPSKL